ncbi:hypothetical protein BJF93_10095 [Xaviernesmea oryzae]|uniref:Lectin-like protein BA14k n=1 Tax=Xaviernesmea oryzae TaxID=464029 RepID=A0A1Q9AWY3_9HYPH|nr:BA14K family protein [Xaviernesmea oryzae]OLP59938.1 hypothetical protein BJF93_10095 [Xaviernesmea oryzae]SEK44113.1 BA14K-like protein [Xaviernesmea oryzae]
MKKILALIMSAAMALPVALPAQAMPRAPIAVAQDTSDVIQVDNHRRWRPHHGYHRGWRGDHGWRHDGRRHWRGDRGWYRDRSYYRHRDRSWGIPLGALAAGAIIGGAIAAPPPPRRIYRSAGNAHVNWCYARYRSYRAYDNTFQPNYGPRRQCYSPY